MPIWLAPLARFFGGFNIFSGEKLAKLIFYGLLISAGLFIYHKITQDTSVTKVEAGGTVQNFYNGKKQAFFGCTMGRLGVGMTWDRSSSK